MTEVEHNAEMDAGDSRVPKRKLPPVHSEGEGWLTACGQDRANVRLWTRDTALVTCPACLATRVTAPGVTAPE